MAVTVLFWPVFEPFLVKTACYGAVFASNGALRGSDPSKIPSAGPVVASSSSASRGVREGTMREKKRLCARGLLSPFALPHAVLQKRNHISFFILYFHASPFPLHPLFCGEQRLAEANRASFSPILPCFRPFSPVFAQNGSASLEEEDSSQRGCAGRKKS